ncbi:hypothetical protein ABK040_008080 [Willaertia magna]
MSFSQLNHQDILFENIFQFFTINDVITKIIVICKHWKELALQLRFKDFEKSFFYYDKNFDGYCNSLTIQFISQLSLHEPTLEIIEKLCEIKSLKIERLGLSDVETKSLCLKMLEKIVNCNNFKNVSHLTLYRFLLGDEGLKMIENGKNFNNLTYFNGYWNGFSLNSIQLLATSPKFSKLTCLKLTDLHGDKGFKFICDSPNFINLQELDIGQGNISKEGMKYFASSQYLKNIKIFTMDRCHLDGEGIRIMCESENSKNIESLEFEYTYIGDDGVKYIANSPNMCNLNYLDIRRTNSGNECVKYIINSPYMKNLKSIQYEHYYGEDPYYEGKFIDKSEGELLEMFLQKIQ